MKTRIILFLTIAAASLTHLQAGVSGKGGHGAERPVRTILLWTSRASGADSVDQQSFAAALTSTGFSYTKLNPADIRTEQLDAGVMLVAPHASAIRLSNAHAAVLVARVRRGLRLLTDGESPLTAALHIKFGSPLQVQRVIDQLLPDLRLGWADVPSVDWIAEYRAKRSKALYVDSVSLKPLALGIQMGRGKCIVLAPLFDPVSGQGYSRFPTISNTIARFLGCAPMLKRSAVDTYFDPGYRFATPVESLAARWRSWGIKAIHAAAWYDADPVPYDYKRLIEAAHKNGILVYAWLEWPHLGRGFWNSHPEWRQKNALLQDAKLDFLHLMDLQNPDCLHAAFQNLTRLLQDDWDGVDIAEFTITGAGGEALKGPTRPDYFVPFTPSAIAEFKRLAGFDPLELVDPSSGHFWKRDSAALDQFYRYRTSVNNRLLRQVVNFLETIRKKDKRDWELIHTIVDNSLHPEFDYLLGFDQRSTLSLIRTYNVTLNVEDPYMEWLQPPDRYRRLRNTLAALIPDRPAMIDINVVPTHPTSQTAFATEQPTGIEVLQQLQHAGERGGRVCVYCESSVFTSDWQLVPHTMTAGASAVKTKEGWTVRSPATVTLNISHLSSGVLVDGRRWPCVGPDGVVLPAGKHRISLEPESRTSSLTGEELNLYSLTDELIDCRATGAGLDLKYRSFARCLLTFNMAPKSVLVDGLPANPTVLKADGGYVVIAPSGSHRLSVIGH